MDAETRKRIVEMSQGRGVPGKCSMCFVEGAEAMEKLCAEESSSPEALKRLDDTIIRQLQRAHAAELKVRDEREARLVAALDQALRQWEMYVTEAAQDDLEKIEHAEAGELRSCKRVLAEHRAAKGE